jgi:transcription initiation factor IIE alpha subunit
LYFETDEELNEILNNKTNKIRCRFYGIDMERFAKYKHQYVDNLYDGHTYWRSEIINIFNE